jgi:hypothetical protein
MPTFHIHVDATHVAKQFEDHLAELGFKRTDFAGHPEGENGYEAPNHLTLKLYDSERFRTTFDELAATAAATNDAMRGYLEGEFIAVDEDLPDRPFADGIQPPFSVTSASLSPGEFRETEIHITLDRDRSHPKLISSLVEMGFFSAYMIKNFGVAQIFTVQGSRKQVDALLPKLLTYLRECGGNVSCSVKEERVAKYWLTGPNVSLPPVIQSITWTTN